MKRFLKGVAELKTAICVLYTAAMTIYLFFCTVFGHRQISLVMLWTLLAVSAASALIQALCFSTWIIRKMRYTLRSVLFVALFLPLLCFAAWKGEWFPMAQPGAWALFLGIFFLFFIGLTAGFEVYYRAAGKKYDGLIGQYRRQKEQEAENGKS